MSAEPGDSPKASSKRAAVRNATVVGLFGIFVVAVLLVIVRRAFPGRIGRAVEGSLRKRG